jgi:hypothetical protein
MRGCFRLVAVSGVGVLAPRLRDGEQLTRSRDVLGTLAAGEQAVVANAMEAVGSTWIRKRRMNSFVASVIVLYRSRPSMR